MKQAEKDLRKQEDKHEPVSSKDLTSCINPARIRPMRRIFRKEDLGDDAANRTLEYVYVCARVQKKIKTICLVWFANVSSM